MFERIVKKVKQTKEEDKKMKVAELKKQLKVIELKKPLKDAYSKEEMYRG